MNIGSMLLSLAGGLGLFLLGMKMMSDSIEEAAGDKLRSILEMFTKNKYVGLIVGMLFTAVVQSSSACTVMVVSFVNAGLLNLYQAAGVIFGSNIGTTITSQLVSINLSEVAPIFVLLGVIMIMFIKNEKVKKIGSIILGFGILFTGLTGMSSAMKDVREMPQIVDILHSLQNPLLAVFVGFIITAIIQSSSVTVSIVLLMANQGLLELNMCLFIIMGCNIGSCVSALMASVAGKKDAKRAAMIHFLFNVIGTAILFVVFMVAMQPILNLLHAISGDNPGRFVANAHTSIKIAQVVMLLPFSNWIVKLTYLFVPGEDHKIGYREQFALQFIGDHSLLNPATAVVNAINEMERMASLASDNLNRAMNAVITLDQEDIDEVYKVEENINFLNHSITDYLVSINEMPLPIEDVRKLGALFHVVNDIERIGDHAENVADAAASRKESGVAISKIAQKELGEMIDMVNAIIRYSVEMFKTGNLSHMEDIIHLEDAIDEKERELQQSHIDRLTRNECSPEAGMIFSDLVSGLERVADHATNIAFALTKSENL
ncbi:MAG: Na/Pi cotransporter family protein [Lachnospiraceae bacterium]|nr:Na/Pi cotransporter family protein [Lachnospiraceae bacterium]